MKTVLPDELAESTLNLLSERLSRHMADFEKRLLASDTRTVLDKAGEYVTKRDMLTAFENAHLSGSELTALVSIPDPLDRLYKHWAQRDDLTSDMPDLIKSIKCFSHNRAYKNHHAR